MTVVMNEIKTIIIAFGTLLECSTNNKKVLLDFLLLLHVLPRIMLEYCGFILRRKYITKKLEYEVKSSNLFMVLGELLLELNIVHRQMKAQ